MKKDKLKYILIFGIACLAFMVIDDVSAKIVSDIDFKINGNILTTTNSIWTPQGNLDLTFSSNTVLPDVSEIPRYGYVALCAAVDTSYPTWNSTGTYHFDDIVVNPTKQPCNLYNSPGYTPHLVYITFTTFNAYNCSATGETCYLSAPKIQFYSSSSQVWTLNSFGFSDSPIIFDTSSGTIIDQNQTIINQNTQTNSKLDSIIDTGLSDEVNTRPDTSSFDDYDAAESDLMDKVNQADLSGLDIGINTDSSSFVWSTATRLIQSHPAVFGMFISILSIGIIKLALGR